jgi:hypothetical protein
MSGLVRAKGQTTRPAVGKPPGPESGNKFPHSKGFATNAAPQKRAQRLGLR